MELQLIPYEKFQIFLICAARVAALMASLPIFSSGQAPAAIRSGLAIVLSVLLFPVLEPFIPAHSFEPITLAILVTNEALIGVMIGMVARFIFTAAEFGGTVVGYQMGFAAANVFDPQNQRQISLMSQFQNVFAILIFLALDAHHIFLRTIVESYRIFSPGLIDFGGESIPYFIQLAGSMFVLGVKFSAPVLAVLLLSGLILGIMARIFPQLNVFMLSFPLNIGLAFVVMGLTLNLVASMLGQEFNALEARFLHLFTLF